MGDMAEDFRFLSAQLKLRRKNRAEKATQKLAEFSERYGITETQENVFKAVTPFGAVMFYSSSGKTQHKGSMSVGGVENFIRVIERLRSGQVTYVER